MEQQAHLRVVSTPATEIPLQTASQDIWDKKYRLKTKDGRILDQTIDDTFKRIARALSEVEESAEKRERWYEQFLWALRHGAIPAGRIVSNAGALEHKPATSTINCTVSGTIEDSMDGILRRVHEAGLTLKAGCVAPDTKVITERGVVTARCAVEERHASMLCYDRDSGRFEMRAIERHMTTHVPQAENIEIVSNGVALKTSIKHPVLVFRNDELIYVRADEINANDALVHHAFLWQADESQAAEAWFTGAHLGDGSAYEKRFEYHPARKAWATKARAAGRRLVFKIRAAEREVVERYATFFNAFCGSRAKVVAAATPNGTPIWDYTVSSFEASRAASLIDNQTGKKSADLHVPAWISAHPDRHFLPFLAGLIDTDGTVGKETGSVWIAMQNPSFAEQLKTLLGMFGVYGAITIRKPREHHYHGKLIRDAGGAMLKISDSAFLARVAAYMADSGKRGRITNHATTSGQYDRYRMPARLSEALSAEADRLGHRERQTLGFYHGYHRKETISRVWIDRWSERFPHLRPLLDFARTLRPVEAIHRNLDIGETFYDFTVEKHHNYLAGENGFMVIHNCGIGYDFSTLRPRGGYVSGAGAYTSGPMSFMDIYDKMCFTVSSAGGRRGAQMGTFDIGHPDVIDFIRAKRENGRLRQFNLSLLITDEFMHAVKNDQQWRLAFPLPARVAESGEIDLNDPDKVVWREWPITKGYLVNEAGLVACKVERMIKARRLWDLIMTSTYDFAEPGFILIDKYNEMNNNWFCENIRATNPCVTADTWVQTAHGPRQVGELVGTSFLARVDGEDHATGPEGFFKTADKAVVRITTREGYQLRLTDDHRVRRVTRFTRYITDTEWCAAGDLRPGDRVLLNDHRSNPAWPGAYGKNEGYLIGLLVGDGTLKRDAAVLSVWMPAAAVNGTPVSTGVDGVMARALAACESLRTRADFTGWREVTGRNEYRLSAAAIKHLADELELAPGRKTVTPAIERTSSEFARGFLRGLFDSDGSVQGAQDKGVSVRLAQSDAELLEAVQRMLLRLGIASTIHRDRRPAGMRRLPDDQGGMAEYPTRAQHELLVSGENLARFAELVGFSDTSKAARLADTLGRYHRRLNRERFTARIESVTADGFESVFDVQVPGINTFDANGLHAHNCGEQGLPPYGSCLLGSINLAKFVRDPFTDKARFDWDEYRKAVAIFTRMLDNVVEINGLPLPQQRDEIVRKRRHGMGYLGLGSTLAMLRMKYGDPDSLEFTERVTREMALVGWETALDLAQEKGPAPIMLEEFTVTAEMLRKRPEMARDGYRIGDTIQGKVLHARYSRYMQRIAGVAPELVNLLAEVGARFTHHSSIAPTGTISLSLANNASNGIEPSFAHHYYRNVIREGRKSKEKIDVYSYELLAYRERINPGAIPGSDQPEEQLPDWFVSADDITPKAHVDVQAAAQKWIDSSISKTANVPGDYDYEDFKGIYLYAYEQDLKGCTTFRFNPEAFQGVLVKEKDLANTTYRFQLEDGSVVEARGNEEIEYDGETHSAANLYDALKEGYYGKY